MTDPEKIISYTLGPFMFIAGLNKLIGPYLGSSWAKDVYTRNGNYPFKYYASGIIEAIGGPLLLSSEPKVKLSGVVGLLGMIAWLELAGLKKTVQGRGEYLSWVLRMPALATEVGLALLGWWAWWEL